MFVNLHRHSMWSLLDGTGSGQQYAKRAKELGQTALALTDHGTLAGMLEHVAACRDEGIFPIMGVEAYFRESRLVRDRLTHDAEGNHLVDKNGRKITKLPKRYHLTLLAGNFEGWLNIQRMTSEAYQSGMIDFSDRPCIDWDLLLRYNEGVYCLGGCYGSLLSQDIMDGGYATPGIINRFKSIFGDRFALEIMPHDWDEQRALNINTVNVAFEHGIPLVATGDTHYPFQDWASTQDIMLMLNTGQTNLKRKAKRQSGEEIYTMVKENPTLYLMGEDDMKDAFARFHPNLPADVVHEAIQNTGVITSGFVPIVLDRQIKMPTFTKELVAKIDPVAAYDPEEDPAQIVKNTLRRWCKSGLDQLVDTYPASHWEAYSLQRYQEQLEHEFDTFDQIGDHVWRYMLMVAGEVRWARSQGIIVGPGRGSAAGSLVAYLSGITDIDPISYGLLFERFINPNRKGMPDIDIDFMPGAKGRDLVEEHTGLLYNEPGRKNVIKIAAYSTYGPKAALRSVCRVFDDVIDYAEADRYAKVLDQLKATDKIDLEECAERFVEIAEFKQRYPTLWDQAVRLEGAPFSQSEHASGVLVKPSSVELPTAVKKDKDSGEVVTTTAWPDTREQLANYGFLKIDYLVINGLVRQYDIVNTLRERDGLEIDLRNLPVRWDPYAVDPEVMEVFKKGHTLGVWQFEGKGTIPVLKAVQPENMHDIAAINALIRPGARGAGMTELYAKIKHGQAPLEYWHESVEPFLSHTYGLMIYQEQMMEMAVALGDFTRTEADDLRKAMGKKYREGLRAVIKFLDELGFGTKFKHNAALKVGEEMAITIWEDKMLPFGEYSFNAAHAYAYGLISYHDAMLKHLAPADFYAGYLGQSKSKDLPLKLSSVVREGSRFNIRLAPPDINRSSASFSVTDSHTIRYGIESVKGVGPAGVAAIFEHRPFTGYEDFCERIPARLVNKNAKDALVGAGAFDEFRARDFLSDQDRAAQEEQYLGMRVTIESEMTKYADMIESTIHSEAEFDQARHGDTVVVGGEVLGVKETHTKRTGDAMAFVNVAYGADSYRVTFFPKHWAGAAGAVEIGKPLFIVCRKEIDEKYGPGLIAQQWVGLPELVAMKTGVNHNAS